MGRAELADERRDVVMPRKRKDPNAKFSGLCIPRFPVDLRAAIKGIAAVQQRPVYEVLIELLRAHPRVDYFLKIGGRL